MVEILEYSVVSLKNENSPKILQLPNLGTQFLIVLVNPFMPVAGKNCLTILVLSL